MKKLLTTKRLIAFTLVLAMFCAIPAFAGETVYSGKMKILNAWLNKVFGRDGHAHDGKDADGSAPVIAYPLRSITNTTSLDRYEDYRVAADATSGTIYANLPLGADAGTNREYIVQKTDSSANTVIVNAAGADTIEGVRTSVTLTVMGDTATVRWNGSQWKESRAEPVSTLKDFAGATAPYGYIICNGTAVSRTGYAALFAVIGTTYGVGDGSTTFNVPDLRGRIIAGKDNMGGSSANRITNAAADSLGGAMGAETHTLSETEMPQHNHSMYTMIAGVAIAGGSGFQGSTSVTGNTGGGQAHNNVQPTLFVNKLIKY